MMPVAFQVVRPYVCAARIVGETYHSHYHFKETGDVVIYIEIPSSGMFSFLRQYMHPN